MYGSVEVPARATGPARVASYAALAVSLVILAVVIYVAFVTNEVVSLLRPLENSPVQRQNTAFPDRRSLSLAPLRDDRAPNILVVHGGDQNLHEFGVEVARGARSLTSHVRVLHVANATFDGDVLWADGILLGSNVYNANVDPVLMRWINTWDMQQDLSHKVAGAFVVAGGLSAGEEVAQLALLRSMLVLRLVVAGGATWTSAFGASAVVGEGPYAASPPQYPSVCYPANSSSSIAPIFLDKAHGLGARVASIAAKLAAA